MERRIQAIDRRLLDDLSASAKNSDRLRRNFNLHSDYEEPCQRLLNAIEPGSYIRPHRHLTPPKPETFLAVRGCMAILIFGDSGEIQESIILSAGGDVSGADVPAGAWHTVISLEEGSVFFETKPGPYQPLSDKDWAPWAPHEGSVLAVEYLRMLVKVLDSRYSARTDQTSC